MFPTPTPTQTGYEQWKNTQATQQVNDLLSRKGFPTPQPGQPAVTPTNGPYDWNKNQQAASEYKQRILELFYKIGGNNYHTSGDSKWPKTFEEIEAELRQHASQFPSRELNSSQLQTPTPIGPTPRPTMTPWPTAESPTLTPAATPGNTQWDQQQLQRSLYMKSVVDNYIRQVGNDRRYGGVSIFNQPKDYPRSSLFETRATQSPMTYNQIFQSGNENRRNSLFPMEGPRFPFPYPVTATPTNRPTQNTTPISRSNPPATTMPTASPTASPTQVPLARDQRMGSSLAQPAPKPIQRSPYAPVPKAAPTPSLQDFIPRYERPEPTKKPQTQKVQKI